MAAGTIKNLGPIDMFKAEDIKNIEKFNDQMDLFIKKTQVQSVSATKASYNIAKLAFDLFNLTNLGQATAFLSKLRVAPASSLLAADKFLSQNGSLDATKDTKKADDRFVPPEMVLAKMKSEKFALGGAQDSLARIGGFTGFQTAQDSIIKQAIEQTLQLKLIAKSSATTAQVISRE
jgi:hypothetical protein